jgi:predicted P-loop ATPase
MRSRCGGRRTCGATTGARRRTGWRRRRSRSTSTTARTARRPTPRAELLGRARSGVLPGSVFHLTPHGARVAFLFADACSDRDIVLAAAAAAQELVGAAIAGTGYRVDPAPTKDLARLFYAPRALAKGVQRDAEVVVMRRDFYAPAELAAAAPTPAPAPSPPANGSSSGSTSIAEAIARFNREHQLDVRRHSDTCPVCGHKGCFGTLPDDDQRWHCFSTAHPNGVGIRGTQGFHGDALDLFAHDQGVRPVDVLTKLGYLKPRTLAAPATPATTDAVATVTSLDAKRRPLRNNSYLTALTIVRENARDVLRGRRLELNEMSGRPELGRQPLRDEAVTTIRGEVERLFVGGVDGNGNEIGLKLSLGDVYAACQQVASENSYHPVREYLAALEWDGVDRLDSVAADILNAEDSPLNRVMVRKFFVSAAARAMEPGCKVDTVLILVGKQGKLKSSFFDALAAPWFVDSNVDITNKDVYQVLRSAWIFEWGELEKNMRYDMSVVKSFVTSRVDSYRPPHGRHVVDVPRSGVIVGSTNEDEFLTDETGARRFWPVRVGARIELDVAVAQRDQLWAEAAHRWSAWVDRGRRREECPWWLTDDEDEGLRGTQDSHRVRDAWESLVLSWGERQLTPFATGDVLAGALKKEPGTWTRADEMRVARVLKGAGYERKSEGPSRSKKWSRT